MSQNMIGKVIKNHYTVTDFVASGSMKTVYRVWDSERNVPLAMKMLHVELGDDPAVLRSFRRDARAIKSLVHPNIIRFYGMEQSGSQVFMLEEYIDGHSLKDTLEQRKKLNVDETLEYLKALCAALGYAHSKGVVHCDVKPANVMINQHGNIQLTDFGIARHAGSDATMTLAGAGTPAYMAPEQVRGDVVTPATDVYALGVMLFEMLTGQRPFKGTENGSESGGSTQNERVRYAHLKIQPPDPRLINPKIEERMARVILRALEKDPARRYQTAQEFYLAACQSLIKEPVAIQPAVAALAAEASAEAADTTVTVDAGEGAVEAQRSAALPARKNRAALIAWIAAGCLAVGLIVLGYFHFDLQSELDDTQYQLDRAQDTIRAKSTAIASGATKLMNVQVSMQATASAQKSIIATLSAEKLSAQNSGQTLQVQLSDAQGQVASLQSDLSSVKDTLSSRESDLSSAYAQIDSLEEQLPGEVTINNNYYYDQYVIIGGIIVYVPANRTVTAYVKPGSYDVKCCHYDYLQNRGGCADWGYISFESDGHTLNIKK